MNVSIDNFRAELSRYVTGETVRVLASFTDVVSVDTRRGVPVVVFDNGAVGRYESGSGTDKLVFSYFVDGQLMATSAALDQAAINAGTYHFTDDDGSTTTFDLNTPDDNATTGGDITQGNDKAIIQLKVTNSSSTEVQSLTDTTWEYQW